MSVTWTLSTREEKVRWQRQAGVDTLVGSVNQVRVGQDEDGLVCQSLTPLGRQRPGPNPHFVTAFNLLRRFAGIASIGELELSWSCQVHHLRHPRPATLPSPPRWRFDAWVPNPDLGAMLVSRALPCAMPPLRTWIQDMRKLKRVAALDPEPLQEPVGIRGDLCLIYLSSAIAHLERNGHANGSWSDTGRRMAGLQPKPIQVEAYPGRDTPAVAFSTSYLRFVPRQREQDNQALWEACHYDPDLFLLYCRRRRGHFQGGPGSYQAAGEWRTFALGEPLYRCFGSMGFLADLCFQMVKEKLYAMPSVILRKE